MDADFAVDLLGELVRAYLAATNIRYQASHGSLFLIFKSHVTLEFIQDCCAYAMQEILSIFECGNRDPERYNLY